jgi:hypothetical protein
MPASYLTKPEKPIKAIERRQAHTNSMGVPFKKAGTGLVLILLRIPARSRSETRKPRATPKA